MKRIKVVKTDFVSKIFLKVQVYSFSCKFCGSNYSKKICQLCNSRNHVEDCNSNSSKSNQNRVHNRCNVSALCEYLVC